MVILAIFLYAPLPGTCMGADLRFDFIYLRFDNSPKCTTPTTLSLHMFCIEGIREDNQEILKVITVDGR